MTATKKKREDFSMVFLKVIVVLVFLLPLQNIFAQDIDKSLYKKTMRAEVDWDPEVTEYYKFDAVFLGRRPGAGVEFFRFFEMNGDDQYDDSTSEFPGPNTLPQIKAGQFVTIYFRVFPRSSTMGLPEYLVDNIEIPAEDFSFTATHRTIEKTNITFPVSEGVLLTLDSGVEVQVLGRDFHISQEDDGKGGLLTGYWMWLVTADSYGGWVFSHSLEPLPHTANMEIPTDFSFEPTHKAIRETTIWRYPGDEPRTTIDSGVEVQVYHTDPDIVSSEGETGRCLYLVTANGYLGYAFASHFEPLQPTAVVEPPPAVVNEPEPAVTPEAEQSSTFPLPWTIAALGVVLLGVIIVIIAAKPKKRGD